MALNPAAIHEPDPIRRCQPACGAGRPSNLFSPFVLR